MRKTRRSTSGRGPERSAAKERFWRGHIARQAAGHLSIRAYCADHGVSEPSFYAWRRELVQRDRVTARRTWQDRIANHKRSPVEFVRLDVGSDVGTSPIEIVLGEEAWRGAVVRVPRGTDQATLFAVLSAVTAARAQQC